MTKWNTIGFLAPGGVSFTAEGDDKPFIDPKMLTSFSFELTDVNTEALEEIRRLAVEHEKVREAEAMATCIRLGMGLLILIYDFETQYFTSADVPVGQVKRVIMGGEPLKEE